MHDATRRRIPSAWLARVRIGNDFADRSVGQRRRTVTLELPRDALDEPLGGGLLGEPEAIQERGAIRELGGGNGGALAGAIVAWWRALEPRKRHGASILDAV